jgi:membrane complex biogenesis BtpA family protein
MSVATAAVASCGVPFGVNVLRNDGSAALGIAASTGASLIRVNVLAGLMNTDQGPMVGRAAELLRKRAALCPDVEIWADVMVKHASPPPGLDAAQAALDTVERGLADALIVSGSGTGAEVDLEQAREVAGAVPEETRIVIGSGATADNLESVMTLADSVIVGSWLKIDGVATNRPDPARVGEFVRQASASGLL